MEIEERSGALGGVMSMRCWCGTVPISCSTKNGCILRHTKRATTHNARVRL